MRAKLWLRVGAGVAAGAGAGLVALAATAPVYESSTTVLVESVLGTEVNMRTEAELVRSTETAADASSRLTGDPTHAVATGRLVGVEPVPGTSVLMIIFEAGTPEAARAGASAYAEAYLAGRADGARAEISGQITSVQRQLDEVHTQLGEVSALLAQLPSRDPQVDALRATQASLSEQMGSLTAQLNELQTTAVNPGRIVAQAALPTAPVRPDRGRYLGIASGIGALGGVVVDLARTRWSRRVRQSTDLRGVPVLADLEPAALLAAGGHQDPNGRAFNRLRNEVVAALSPADHTVLVTGAAPGAASTLVAAHLAAAFARADNDVILVGASVPDLDSAERAVTLAEVFDLADIPGLTDVLAGRTTLARAVQRAARAPRLQVVTPGGTASAGGLLQSEGARSVLRQLATRTRYVIVDAPSTASGADAQSLACAADAVLLVVEAGHAQHSQVADATTQLVAVGTRLLGAVVVPARTAVSPYGVRPAPSEGGTRRVLAVVPGYGTEAWTASRTDALNAPTTKLDLVNRRPPARARAPMDAETPTVAPAQGDAGDPPADPPLTEPAGPPATTPAS